VQDIDGGAPRAFTPANIGANLLRWWTLPVSPDGSRVVARNGEGIPAIYRISDGQAESVPGMVADDVPVLDPQFAHQPHDLLQVEGAPSPPDRKHG
jgi:hypothetical protein